MSRADFTCFLAGLFFCVMAWLDAGWRWFWAAAAALMIVWSLWSALGPRPLK